MATRPPKEKNPTRNRLAEIVAYRRSQGGGVTSSLAGGIKERLKEKFDPRQLINQKGLLTALFPGLKAYQYKTVASEISKSSTQISNFDEILPTLEVISFNTRTTAKNTMVLPALHRDVNVIRQNMVKLVKMKGGDARTKADMFFMKAKDREEKYERELKKEKINQNKIQKLKDDEDKKTKSFLGKIFSTIIKGLGLIAETILKLGKAIIGAFKFLAGVIIDVISGLSKFLLESLLGFNLSDKLKNFFKSFFQKNWIKSLFRAFGRGIFNILFSRLGLRFLAGKLTLIMGAIFFGREWLKAYTEKKLQEGEIPLEQERQAFEDENLQQQFPLSSIGGKDLDYYREMSLLDVDERTIALGGIQGRGFKLDENMKREMVQFFDKNILFEYNDGKRQAYNLKIPGLTGSQLLLLTEKEAREWGDNRRKYLAIIDQLIKFKSGKIDLSEEKLGQLYDEYTKSRLSLLDLSKKYINEQLLETEQQKLLRAIELSKERKQEDITDIMSRNFLEDYLEPAFESIYPSIESADKFIEKPDNSLGLIGFQDFKQKQSDLVSNLKQNFESRSKQIEGLIDKTMDNRRKSVVFKQPIVVEQTNLTKKTDSLNNNETPASAWNNEFIDNYFNDIISNPLGIK